MLAAMLATACKPLLHCLFTEIHALSWHLHLVGERCQFGNRQSSWDRSSCAP